ncbi:MAG: M23 family metallopeptidase [Henriciella sp.]|nr:M23 family metallopeptidase [Henriciella sp.]
MRCVYGGLATFLLAACASPAPVTYPSPGSAPSVYERPAAGDIQTSDLFREAPPQGPFQPNVNLFACDMRMSNRPGTNGSGMILNYSPLVVVSGVVMATAPVNDVCLSSGFGYRGGRLHKGIDLFARPAGPIYSAAPGRILEVSKQSGFGNQVLIEHGNGVYSRYAHLASFAPAMVPGHVVGFGEPLGMMGRSGNATGIHLHYEILTGNYNTPQKSWGLTAHNPLDFPAWEGLDDLS